MSLEAVLFGSLILVALLVLVVGLARRRSRSASLAAGAILLLSATAIAWFVLSYRPPASGESSVTDRPIELPQDGYVKSDTCRFCHPEAYATWHASYHRKMTRVADRDSVRGDFDDVTLHLGDFTYRLSRDREGYRVSIDAPPKGYLAFPESKQRRVMLVTGSHHYQVYWLNTPNGRELEQFPFAWLLEERQWVSRAATVMMPYAEFLGVRSGSWNRACVRCHTVNGRPRLRPNREVDTQVSELGIACEACHGPAEEHVRKHRDPSDRYRAHLGEDADPSIVQPARLPAERSVQVCGQCHGITENHDSRDFLAYLERGYRYRPGDDLNATRYVVQHPRSGSSRRAQGGDPRPELPPAFLEKRFWSDGMIRVVGREYNALLENPCFQKGSMTCLSCHRMHRTADDPRTLSEWADDQLEPNMEGRQACLQCHEQYRDAAALVAHTHHDEASTGSDCYDCHMPHTTYGLLKAIRSHTIDSPTVVTDLQSGRPNACNLCHLDRTLAWTAEHLEQWYGIPVPRMSREERSVAASLLWLLRGDAAQRALLAWHMGWEPAGETSGTSWMAPFVAQLLADPYEAVRLSGYRSLRRLPGFEGFEYDLAWDAEARNEAVRRAAEQWEQQSSPRPEEPTALLFEETGAVDESALRDLLARRDDRRVQLTE